MILYILIAILIFGILIFVHELGHFLAAKAFRVRVNEFAICMGPAIWQKTKGETTYSLRAIPIGGYCAMEGEDEQSDDPRAFSAAKPWKRLVILAAGAAFNFLIGLLILLVIFSFQRALTTTQIDGFFQQSTVSEETGLQIGDEFYSIDGERVYRYSDISLLLSRGDPQSHRIVVIRDGKRVDLGAVPLRLRTFTENGETVTRYGLYFRVAENSFGGCIRAAWYTALDFARLVRLGLQDLVHGLVGVRDLSGPVGIVSAMAQTGEASETAGAAAANLALFAAFLAVNLSVMNLLPLPALDGGRIFFLVITWLIETVFKKKINGKYEAYIHTAGMILLLAFLAFITLKDIVNLFG